MNIRHLICGGFVILLTFLLVQPASAHNTQPRVEISTERTNPGTVVDVRGVSFGMEDVVTLALIGSTVEYPLGEMLANAEGEFTYIAVLPPDLVEGSYYFRATTSHHWVISPPIAVWGTAITEGGEQGPRDEDDGLLAPMPTREVPAPAAQVASAVSTPVVLVPGEETAVSAGWSANILMLVFLMGIVAVVLLVLGRKKSV